MKLKKELLLATGNIVALWSLSLVGRRIGTACYTFDWILNRKMYLYAAIITTCGFQFGKWRFATSVLIGVFLGVICGELFGVPTQRGPDDVTWLHYGWLIWLGCVLVSVLIGVLAEVLHSRKGNH